MAGWIAKPPISMTARASVAHIDEAFLMLIFAVAASLLRVHMRIDWLCSQFQCLRAVISLTRQSYFFLLFLGIVRS